MDRRAALRRIVGVGIGVGLAGCTGQSATPSGDYDVGMSTARFRPAAIEVPAGTTVVWRNTSSHAHTVTAYDDRIPDEASYFASGDFATEDGAVAGWRNGAGGALYGGDEFTHTFEVPGSYSYFCIPHEMQGMTGTVEVTASD